MIELAIGWARAVLCLGLTAFVLYSSDLIADCDGEPGLQRFAGQGWGLDLENRRFQAMSEIGRENVAQLELAWVFALDGGTRPHSYPAVSEDTLFIGSESGNVYALDRESGCERWTHRGEHNVRTAVIHGRMANGEVRLFYGTAEGWVHSVDARTGTSLWSRRIADHTFATSSGTPSFQRDRLFVPVSSIEVAMAVNPLYGCCTFRGSVLALEAADGANAWRAHSIETEPYITGRRALFIEEWGPSGAPIWSAPAYDAKTNLVFVGTGQNYSGPATETSDAIIAFDADTGERRWVRQFNEDDVFNVACWVHPSHPNCPDENGPDLDFGAPPVIAELGDGRRVLLGGQKSGGVFAMHPETGELLWQTRIGRGGYLGGVHWGLAVNERLGLLYVPISDDNGGPVSGESAAGLHALDLATGAPRWRYASPDTCAGKSRCWAGFSAAILATDELVFAGALDGMLRAFDAENGEVLWSFQTWREYQSVNGRDAWGGAIDVHGPMLFEDLLLIQSGYKTFAQAGGNSLLAFRIGDR